jgi:hypothetical protein
MTKKAIALTDGVAEGRAIVLVEPLSFWGGVDAATGEIIDSTHPDHGKNLAGRILVMDAGRGSSSSSSVFAETIRRGTGPVGVVLERADPILLVGALVAKTLYGLSCPIVICPDHHLVDGEVIVLEADAKRCTIHKVASSKI